MRGQRAIFFDGMKAAAAPWDFDNLEGWTVLGQPANANVDTYFRRVPWLYRGVVDRANNVGSMPFVILRGKTEYDTSQDYQNKLQFLPDPGKLFEQIEQSMTMTGRAWLFLERNPAGYVKSIKYCSPYSIEEVRDQETGELTGYTRVIGSRGRKIDVKIESIVPILDNEYMTEAGPPTSSAAGAALTSAGVLYNADKFITNYFERGAIKATILTVDGGNREEAERLQSWWGDVIGGIKNAWSAVVLRMQQVKATIIGEGLESLENKELTAEMRQDIAAALGIPESRLWSAAANYATRAEDEKAYYTSTIIPECKAIAAALNAKLFTAENRLAGFSIHFVFDTLDMFQEDTNQQAQAAKNFIDFLTACPTAEIAKETAAMIGFELTDAMIVAIDTWFADKQAAAEVVQEQMQPAPVEEEPTPAQEVEAEPNPQEMRAALAAWKRKAIKAVRDGQPALVEFTSSIIPLALQGAIAGALECAKTEHDIKTVFGSSWRGYP